MTNAQTAHNDVEAIRKLLGETLDSFFPGDDEVEADKSRPRRSGRRPLRSTAHRKKRPVRPR